MVIEEAMSKASLKAGEIWAMGITTQRNTMILWDKYLILHQRLPISLW